MSIEMLRTVEGGFGRSRYRRSVREPPTAARAKLRQEIAAFRVLGEACADERAARHDLEPAAAHLVEHAGDELRSEAAPASRDRRLGVRQRHDIAGEAISHVRGDALGVEREAG